MNDPNGEAEMNTSERRIGSLASSTIELVQNTFTSFLSMFQPVLVAPDEDIEALQRRQEISRLIFFESQLMRELEQLHRYATVPTKLLIESLLQSLSQREAIRDSPTRFQLRVAQARIIELRSAIQQALTKTKKQNNRKRWKPSLRTIKEKK